jgi:hypothetical protein
MELIDVAEKRRRRSSERFGAKCNCSRGPKSGVRKSFFFSLFLLPIDKATERKEKIIKIA